MTSFRVTGNGKGQDSQKRPSRCRNRCYRERCLPPTFPFVLDKKRCYHKLAMYRRDLGQCHRSRKCQSPTARRNRERASKPLWLATDGSRFARGLRIAYLFKLLSFDRRCQVARKCGANHVHGCFDQEECTTILHRQESEQ